MKRALLVFVLVLLAGGGFAGGIWYGRRQSTSSGGKTERKVLYWVDPMHPSYKSDKPGIAPDCGMKLEPVYEEGAAAVAAAPKPGKILYYGDPKDPNYRSDKPGINPETGNDLEAVYEHVPTIDVSATAQRSLGVKFDTVTLAAGESTIHAVGKVAADERRVTRVHPRIDGWIHKTHIDFMGQFVSKGDPMLTLYSPDLLASQNEYLLALRARDSMKGGPSRDAYENSELLVLAARKRIELWDLSAAQIEELERTRKPVQTVTLYSPTSGYVTSRNAFPSQRVTPETELYAITDLSHVWIVADVFEPDAPNVRVGQTAMVSMPTAKGRSFAARVTYIQPQVDPATRTLKVRLEAANDGLAFKPEMFVDVDFRVSTGARLSVPTDAVVNTGLRKTVFVDRGNGQIEPRAVETGERAGDRVQIVSGLRAGERVVSSGAFLIDSEAQLKNVAPAPGGRAHD